MKNTRLTALIILLLSNLSGLACVSFAWFYANTKANDAASQIGLIKSELVESYTFHDYFSVDEVQQSGHYTFEINSSDTNDLGKYSIIGSDFQSLLKVDLTDYGSDGSISVAGQSTADFYHGETQIVDGEEVTSHLLAKEGNSLSSIVCFYFFEEDEVSVVDGHYDLNVGTKTKFNFVKTENGKKFINNDKIEFCTITNARTFFILIDYDVELIEEIYSLNLGNAAIGGEIDSDSGLGSSYISYVTDFSFSVMKVG